MFHLLRRKPTLKDLITSDYVDIHSHLLPGIDDGAATSEITFQLITAMRQLGFDQCITTPHIFTAVWDNTPEIIEKKYDEISAGLPNLTFLRFGAEYMIDPNFVKMFQNGKLATLKENYVLVELSYINPPIQLFEILFDLQIAGYRPIIAHPERYPYYNSDLSAFSKLKNAGCLFQLNLLSTVGYYGIEANKSAELLLKKGLVDFVGSDIHHQNHIESFSRPLQISNVSSLTSAIRNNQFFRQ